MSLLEDCEKYFNANSLYEVLQVSQNASQTELKKAYKKMSLAVHPDRVAVPQAVDATRKFQILSKVHSILSDVDKRAVYDETGEVDEEHIDKMFDWDDYWRLIFPKLTVQDIDDFKNKYIGSEEEREDLKKWYLELKGDMSKMSEYLLSYTYLDEERYCELLHDMIKKEEIPAYPAFTKETAAKKRSRRRKFEREASEAEELSEELMAKNQSLLKALERSREGHRKDFVSMLSGLEQKYGKKPRSKKSK